MKMSKALMKHITQLVIDNNAIGVPMAGQDLAWFRLLYGDRIKAACRMVNPEYPSDPRHVQVIPRGRADYEPWSWNKAISAVSDRHELHAVMRKAVEPDRDEAAEAIEDVCEQCGATDDIQMDHLDPPFVEMADAWLAQFEPPPSLIDGPSGIGRQFENVDVEADWIKYHAERVIWQKLCRSCNARKGARGSAPEIVDREFEERAA